MTYCTQADIELLIDKRILTQLSNDDPTATEPNLMVVNEAIVFADGEINGYLRVRYSLPLVSFDNELKGWATFIARYWLYSRRMGSRKLPSDITIAYDEAMKKLEAVRDGKYHLGVGDSVATDGSVIAGNGGLQPEAGQIRIRSGERIFSANRLKQF